MHTFPLLSYLILLSRCFLGLSHVRPVTTIPVCLVKVSPAQLYYCLVPVHYVVLYGHSSQILPLILVQLYR
ncbi:hypothetical protein PISMIDRAFT_670115 [Pisolithus microcarpus 441]|uniref:Secreted protein n=1 Tax=Pisolithus microcarpus 441 TaxID=765257 RepID=A0A0C9Z0W9_9AGAM|nr:hypothetical protein PISMIDRAFT_670115 [Pisolithus microcarpus 441]